MESSWDDARIPVRRRRGARSWFVAGWLLILSLASQILVQDANSQAPVPPGVEHVCADAGFPPVAGTRAASPTQCVGAAGDMGLEVGQNPSRREAQDGIRTFVRDNRGSVTAGPGDLYGELFRDWAYNHWPEVVFVRGRCSILIAGGSAAGGEELPALRAVAARVDRALLALPALNVCTVADEGEGPTPTSIRIDHIEIVQVVQDEHNGVPLVANKTGVVRVFVIASPPVAGVSARVSVHRPRVDPVALAPINATITARAAFDRENTNDSLNFRLPGEVAGGGTYPIEATLVLPPGVTDPKPEDKQRSVQAVFIEHNDLYIAYLSVCYLTAAKCPSAAVANHANFLAKVFPVRDRGVLYYPLAVPPRVWTHPLGTAAELNRLAAAMQKAYVLSDSIDLLIADQFAVWLPDDPGISVYGMSDPVWAGSKGRVTFEEDYGNVSVRSPVTGNMVIDPDAPSRTLAHEIGHNLGLHHTSKTKLAPNVTAGGCGSTDASTDWPTAGPAPDLILDPTTQEVGWDTDSNQAVPASRFDMMSYCSPPAGGIWISPFDYKKLSRANFQPTRGEAIGVGERRVSVDPGPLPLDGGARTVATPAEFFIVGGTAKRDGSAATLDPAYRVTASIPALPQHAGGNHCLRFLNGADALASYCFDLAFVEHQSQAPVDEESFSLKVPFPSGATKVSLMRGTKELASLAAGAASPTVQISAPVGGETWDDQATVAWTSNGAAATAILYSPDDKKTWYPLDVDTSIASTTFDARQLQRGENVYVRVLVSDGFNTAQADAGPVKTPNGRLPVDLRSGNTSGGTNPPASQSGGSSGGSSRVLIFGLLGAALVVTALGGLAWRSGGRPHPTPMSPGIADRGDAGLGPFCQRCGSPFPRESRFCGQCGAERRGSPGGG